MKSWWTKYDGEIPGRKCKWKTRFDDFLRSGDKKATIDWKALGYKNYNVARSCIGNAINRVCPEKLEITAKDGIIYLERKDI